MNRDLSKRTCCKVNAFICHSDDTWRFAAAVLQHSRYTDCRALSGEKALAAVGSSFTLMTFITSILLGLCMGSGALFSIRFGQRDENGLKEDICASFFFIAAVTLLLNMIAYVSLDGLRSFPQEFRMKCGET